MGQHHMWFGEDWAQVNSLIIAVNVATVMPMRHSDLVLSNPSLGFEDRLGDFYDRMKAAKVNKPQTSLFKFMHVDTPF